MTFRQYLTLKGTYKNQKWLEPQKKYGRVMFLKVPSWSSNQWGFSLKFSVLLKNIRSVLRSQSNIWKPLTIFAKNSLVDVWLGSKYAYIHLAWAGFQPICCFVEFANSLHETSADVFMISAYGTLALLKCISTLPAFLRNFVTNILDFIKRK